MRQKVRYLMVLASWLTVAGVALRVGLKLDVPWKLLGGLYAATAVLAMLSLCVPGNWKEEEPIQAGVRLVRVKLLLIPFFLLNFLAGGFCLIFGIFYVVTLPLIPVLVMAAWLVRRATSDELGDIYWELLQAGILTREEFQAHKKDQRRFVLDVFDGLDFLWNTGSWSAKWNEYMDRTSPEDVR